MSHHSSAFADHPSAKSPEKLRQPLGLYLLFVTEMWERFSYYGMRAFLTLYMVTAITEGGLGWNKQQAGAGYGWYTGLVYLTPIAGGYLADRFLGTHWSMVIGGMIIAMGHFVLAAETLPAFYVGCLLLIIGTGMFKPCVSTMVGQLYEPGDKRRDAGFTIYYMGINVGAALGPIVCGWLRVKYGWSYGFGAAGVGMVLGLIAYLLGRPTFLKGIGDPPNRDQRRDKKKAENEPLTNEEIERIAVIFILAFFVIFFWTAFEQAGSSLTLFAEERTDRALTGWLSSMLGVTEFPTDWFQTINPIFILLLAPPFAMLWKRLASADREPSTPVKFGFGLIFLGLGFLLMVLGALRSSGANGNILKVSPLFLIGAYFLHTVGELCLSPVGLSMVTKLSPVRFGSLLMGVWFLANFVANKTAGSLAGAVEKIERGEVYHILGGQADFYLLFVVAPIVAGIVLLAMAPWLKRMMHGRA